MAMDVVVRRGSEVFDQNLNMISRQVLLSKSNTHLHKICTGREKTLESHETKMLRIVQRKLTPNPFNHCGLQ